MKKSFFQLPTKEQINYLEEAAAKLNISAVAIEKDLWLCWILEKLFELPEKMAFKGGTSLSRIFNLIQRFSEDIDITIDYQNFMEPINLSEVSSSQLKKLSKQLKCRLEDYVSSTVFPYLNKNIKEDFSDSSVEITISDNGEKLHLYYPSVLSDTFEFPLLENTQYLRDHVLLEFGIRNSTEPFEVHFIASLLSNISSANDIKFPSTHLNVLSPIRTFWEKATLIHVECHRGRLASCPESLSRHWYDLAMIYKSDIGANALNELNIFESVIEHKKAFYNASYANYDDCLNGNFRLVPDTACIAGLESDFKKMKSAGMFSEPPPSFKQIIEILEALEAKINLITTIL